ncbi:arylsulfatase J-like [Hetaerina americana]|uniref:arylsulfatase J-like n=1 Tax=Hetaerina americana TaxID=62018 RepID=UPI003A7F2E78
MAPTRSEQPHIIFILADDLGWNDVGFHGSDQIPTPNIDALAYGGLILDRYYVTALCTPSRSSLMTGKYPIHTGMQHSVLYGAEPRGLPLTEFLLPEYLRDLGYATHAVGKWHLGFYKDEHTPTHRGFDSHLGFWTGHHDYFDHTAVEKGWWGLDMRRNMDVAWDLHGKYSTDIFTDAAVQVIRNHNTNVTGNGNQPLFLYIAHAAMHSGNPYNPLPVHDDVVKKFENVKGYNRRKFAAMLHKLDESVGMVTDALREKGMLRDSIIVFSTDNGGPAAGFNLNAASNWPLRGVKNTLWEGGVRGAGFIWSPLLNNGVGRVSRQVFHITDWLPTLYTAAKGTKQWNNTNRDPIAVDGHDSWQALVENTPTSRTEILHNIDDLYGNAALTVGDWKVLKGTTYQGAWDSWYGPSGRGKKHTYDANLVVESKAGKALESIGSPLSKELITRLREDAQVDCDAEPTAPQASAPCDLLKSPCLFNIRDDPCEKRNLAAFCPQMLEELLQRLAEYNATAVPPSNLPIDPMGNPKLWQYTWSSFGNGHFSKVL